MTKFVVRLLVAVVVLGALAVAEEASPAGAAVPCAVNAQLTSTPPSDAAWAPAVSANGNVVVFVSDANFGGQNPGGQNELWRKVGTGAPTVLTSNPDDIEIESPDLSANGTRAVFASSADFDGSNSDGNEEIWLWDLNGNPFVEALTQSEGPGSERPRISADGSVIVFHSRDDWDGSNPDGNEEVFLREIGSGAVQISPGTSGDVGAIKPAVSGDGNVVVYESDRDPLGTNPDENVEIFRYVVDTDTTTQLTTTVSPSEEEPWQGSYEPSIDGDGSTVVFETEVAHGALNTALGYALLRWDDGTLTRVSADGGGSSVSADGSRVVFVSDQNLVGQNADGNDEVFVRHGGATRQITRTTGGETGDAGISRNGNHLVFGSDRNVRNSNSDGNFEVYLATCAPVLKCNGQVVTVVVGQNTPTPGNDVIYGSPRGEFVEGKGGNDRYCANAGNDSFAGGPGNDRFFGGLGNDNAAAGDAGDDVLHGDEGDDVLYGDAGTDQLYGGTGTDFLHGGDGTADYCKGDQGTDQAVKCERMFQIP